MIDAIMDRNNWREIGESILKKEGTTLIQSFLDAGLDVNALDDDGITMLTCAVYCNNIEVIEFLVQSGADANIANLDGSKPIHRAAFYGHEDIVKVLLNSGKSIECRDSDDLAILGHAIRGGRLNLVKYLVNNVFDINAAKASDGSTPLHLAALSSSFEIVEYLVKSGADVDCRIEDGFRVLHCASVGESLDVVKCLLKVGCDPNDQDNCNKDTPLHCACLFGTIEILEALVNAGADFNVENINGQTPFNIFIRGPLCLDGIDLFLVKGAYFQPIDYNFITLKPLLKEGILKDVEICTQSLINKFNFADLPKVYEIHEVAQRLPSIEKMKIASHSNMQQNIAESVNYEIQTKGYCNILIVQPIFLYGLCVRSLIQHNGN